MERGSRGGGFPYTPFSGPSRGTRDIYRVTVARFFLRRATAIQILRHLMQVPRDAQATIGRRCARLTENQKNQKKSVLRTSEEARKIYDAIDANEPHNCYNPNTEFPFLGKRLLELQQFIRHHQPQNVRALLNDRRDVAAWYTAWNNQVSVDFLVRFANHTRACIGSDYIRHNNHFLDATFPHCPGMTRDTCQATAAKRSRSSNLTSLV